MSERQGENGREAPDRHGFGSFLRNLLEGMPWSERAESEETRCLAAPSSGLIRVHNANGRTCVIGEDRTDVQIQAQKVARAESESGAASLLEASRLLEERTADEVLELEVAVPSKWNRRGHVNLELRVPRGTSVEIAAANGRVTVTGLCGAVKARSSNGSVELSDVVGDVNVTTSNAKVCCCNTRGKLVARSSNGKIELNDHCGSVNATTSNGLIRASVEELGRRGVQLATSNGRIVLELPDEVDAEVDIRVDNGVIRNDRPLCKASRERNGRLRGRLGNGGAPIRLRTSNGSISLR
ncbi:MAG: DUF4097 family beta strand repeat-containing protein [Myxococcota bacterium]|nr:hypothetical protein [Deltaproteobacteria bacterium]MCP4243872.1 DUF4097 domain-containing protein [bacterium]MDP6073529.1 DUF4097 family beta strand repeat-containing protein [Myxococcota bacterium]MDP6243394.1 DUF4097 family beta strand repeat-containing protein [Myxococcota bacterium]MDP7076162.1 DUF4097 family beta strand repeat-containing protein [Myxococcota bacterium]